MELIMRKTGWLLAVPFALAGCQTWGPTWSEVTGQRFHVTELNRGPVVVEQIDGRSAFPNRRGQAIWMEAGKRNMTLQGVPLRPGWQGTLQEFVLDAQPCKRYYVNAQFENPLSPSAWKPVIDHVESISGCQVTAMNK